MTAPIKTAFDLPQAAVDRFWSHVRPTGFCWEWTARLGTSGYGNFAVTAKSTARAHRVAYFLLLGHLPAGPLDHLCRNPRCVNPDHLIPTTVRGNTLAGFGPTSVNAKKTHCLRGHEFTPENTLLRAGGGRGCRICSRAKWRRWYARNQVQLSLAGTGRGES